MIKKLFENILYARQSDIASAAVRKQILICSIFNLAGIMFLFYYGIDAILEGNFILASVDLSVCAINALNYIYLRRTGNYRISSQVVMCMMGALCFYLLCTGGSYNTGALWLFIMPTLIFYILGLKKGGIVLGFLFLSIIAVFYIPDNPLLTTEYSLYFSSRFLGVFLSVSIIAYAYEYTLEDGRNELLSLTRRLDLLSRRDSLTDLSNRRDVLEKIENELSRFERNQKTFCVVMLDLDDFKEINDKYCHECGDYVLVEIARTLSFSTQKKDCVARWGGEEFLILLPETTLPQATIMAERLRLTVAEKDFSYNGTPLQITFSAGIAEYQQGVQVDDLINTADRLLYKAKDGGKNMVVADSTHRCSTVS